MTEREKGAFVYSGAGRRTKMGADAPPEQRLCDDYHIALQRCLAARNHQQKWCEEEVKSWKQCFDKQRALDGRAHDRQWLDPERYDKQGRPIKKR